MLIIPAKGCDSCIKGSLDFVRNNYQKEHLGFIISGLSRREVRLIVGDESINRSNVIVDDLDYAHQFKLIDVKPKVIFLQKGKVNNAIELTALNSASTLQDIN